MTSDQIPDEAADSTRLAIRILAAIAVLLAAVVLLVASFGLHVLGFVGIGATLVMFAVMLTFTAGN